MSQPHYSDDGRITYNFGAIMDVATAIGTFEGAMDGALQDLYDSFTALFTRDEWTGTAGQACDNARQQWNKGALEIKNALKQVGLKLNLSVERIQQIDHQIAANM
ncbi:MAG TPA: WXG100 family type VII secretion target [Micromonosporaceae bacterium]|jgi:WXG100 family type VII secretion target